ncbi:hypothetical protein BGP_5827 [Beggiatoa sp. PS]|nr:hypothetical protein BGP_5827 [Beggiatoa sp. PS]
MVLPIKSVYFIIILAKILSSYTIRKDKWLVWEDFGFRYHQNSQKKAP